MISMSRNKKCFLAICLVIVFDLLFILLYLVFHAKNIIPQNLFIYENEKQQFQFRVSADALIQEGTAPVVCMQNAKQKNKIKFDIGEPFSLYSKEKGSCNISVKFMGIIPLRKINVHVIPKEKVFVGGKIIGIKINTKGLLVLGTGEIKNIEGETKEPAKDIVKSGDYIVGVDGIEVNDKEQLMDYIAELKENTVVLELERNKKHIKRKVELVENNEGINKLGIWVRDDTQGIGTLTCYKKDGSFVALGHGINDMDLGVTMDIKNGYICNTGIYQIKKGYAGKPGEIVGYLKKSSADVIGIINSNSQYGIKGKMVNVGLMLEKTKNEKKYPIGLKQEIRLGEAYMLSEISGALNAYKIEITKINVNEHEKGLEIKVTDPELIKISNGIVQGQSGSPIIQNGKIIGAVTHVLVNNPCKGYGIFIEEMM